MMVEFIPVPTSLVKTSKNAEFSQDDGPAIALAFSAAHFPAGEVDNERLLDSYHS